MTTTNNGPIAVYKWTDNMLGECIEVHNSNEVSVENPVGVVLQWSERKGKEICHIDLPNNHQYKIDRVLSAIEDYISEVL